MECHIPGLVRVIEGPGAATTGDLRAIERLQRRLDSAKLSLIAKADRQRAHTASGDASTSSWVAGATKASRASASAQIALADALEEKLPATKAALAEGEVSTASAGIIAGAMAKLPEALSPEDRTKVEEALVREAKQLPPGKLRAAATRALKAAEDVTDAEAAQHEEDVLAEQERRAYTKASVTMHDNGDGTTTGRFCVPTGVAHILRKILQSMTAPRRDHQKRNGSAFGPASAGTPHTSTAEGGTPCPGTATAGSGGAGSAGAAAKGSSSGTGCQGQTFGGASLFDVGSPDTGASQDAAAKGGTPASPDTGASQDAAAKGGTPASPGPEASVAEGLESRNSDWDSLDWQQKRGRAFVDLLEHLDTSKLTGRVASTVIVTMTLEQMLGAAAAAAFAEKVANATGTAPHMGFSVGATRTDTGHRPSSSEARRLACNAGILPAVLGGTALPLDLGREQRLFQESQRLALATVYDECAALGCDRPYAWTELHHEDEWERHRGQTNLDKAVPLCGWHHRRAHDAQVTTRIHTGPDGRKTVSFTTP